MERIADRQTHVSDDNATALGENGKLRARTI
jgi:hypothetical protein